MRLMFPFAVREQARSYKDSALININKLPTTRFQPTFDLLETIEAPERFVINDDIGRTEDFTFNRFIGFFPNFVFDRLVLQGGFDFVAVNAGVSGNINYCTATGLCPCLQRNRNCKLPGLDVWPRFYLGCSASKMHDRVLLT